MVLLRWPQTSIQSERAEGESLKIGDPRRKTAEPTGILGCDITEPMCLAEDAY